MWAYSSWSTQRQTGGYALKVAVTLLDALLMCSQVAGNEQHTRGPDLKRNPDTTCQHDLAMCETYIERRTCRSSAGAHTLVSQRVRNTARDGSGLNVCGVANHMRHRA